ncbi:transglycosylase domain-containing protein [Falsiporphyromonas endometrii]|uniref:Transglycosylase domain-containing protein n=1 Tax=Falsiporphyromonas endometrii TaxID=1387297 RepID=A0ABV9K6B9_9PORP
MTDKKKKILKIMWSLFGLFWVFALIIFFMIAEGWIGYMPPIDQLQNPIDKFASQVYSAEGELIGSYSQRGSNRIYVTYKDLSPNIIKALVATEDERFEDHSGIDYKALMRAVILRGILQDKSAGGGSTITQQLAKMLYTPMTKNTITRLMQKPIEWVIATKLERYYTKNEIISMYLNQFDFLYNAIGIRSAAYTYFGKTPQELNIQEAATLVGMCKNPALYNPVLHGSTEKSTQRRNVVLSQMEKAGYITKAELDSLSKLPMEIHFHRGSHKDGIAPYFREYLRLMLTAKKPERSNYASWQEDDYITDSISWKENDLYGWCEKHEKNLYTDGLKIYTTISIPMQRYAEKAVKDQMKDVLQPAFDREKKGNPYATSSSNKISKKEKEQILYRAMRQTERWRAAAADGLSKEEIIKTFYKPRMMQIWTWDEMKDVEMTPLDSILHMKNYLRTGFMAMNPINGHVKAYVGGINFSAFQYDMVSRGRRQIGSTIKPFLYSQAMVDGLTPCTTMEHVPQTLISLSGKPWTPRGRGSGGMVTIQWGLQHSDNWVTAWLMGQTTPHTFAALLKSFGLMARILHPDVSLCMGTCDASVSEMVSAYSTFVNGGIKVAPLLVTRIEDSHGNTIANFLPKTKEVLNQDAALKMLTMLRSVVDGGTGGRLRYRYNLQMPLGGKTGTTQNNSDAWFVGFTPSLVAGCWVGGEDRSIHFDSMAIGQGAAAALPIFGEFMRLVYLDPTLGYSNNEQFNFPPGFQPCNDIIDEDVFEITSDSTGGDMDMIPY